MKNAPASALVLRMGAPGHVVRIGSGSQKGGDLVREFPPKIAL